MMTRDACIDEIRRFLDKNDVLYREDVYVMGERSATFVDIAILDMQLAIDVHDVCDASIDVNRGIKRDWIQQRALNVRDDCGYGFVQMTNLEFADGKIWPFVKAHIEAAVNGRTTLGARKCQLRTLSADEQRQFLDAHHVQKSIQTGKLNLGLTHEDNLVASICIGKSRFERGAYELLRYCVHPSYAVTGGFEKLLAAAKDQLPDDARIISFADLNCMLRAKNVYDKLADPIGVTNPDYCWVNPITGQTYSRYSCMKHRLVQLGADPTLSERQIMAQSGYIRVFKAGSLKYVL